MARAIFISYRRDDSEGEAGRLYDDLVRAYGNDSVFMDVAGINPGIDFRSAIDENVATCGVLLAVMGPHWASIANASGARRLDDANDFVRLEIASALARKIPVIPVLVHEARMPAPDQLPDNLKDLAYRNSVEITHARWNSDVQLLTTALAQYVASGGSAGTEPVHATVPVQLPPTVSSGVAAVPARKAKVPLIASLSAVVAIAIAASVFAALHKWQPNSAQQTPPPVSAAAAPAAAGPTANPMAGTWTNTSTVERNGLRKLEIAADGQQLSIHAWGQCDPTDCDWGQQQTTFDGQKATATWSFEHNNPNGAEKGRVAAVTMTVVNGSLEVAIVNTYPKRPENQRQFTFTKSQ